MEKKNIETGRKKGEIWMHKINVQSVKCKHKTQFCITVINDGKMTMLQPVREHETRKNTNIYVYKN